MFQPPSVDSNKTKQLERKEISIFVFRCMLLYLKKSTITDKFIQEEVKLFMLLKKEDEFIKKIHMRRSYNIIFPTIAYDNDNKNIFNLFSLFEVQVKQFI